MGLVVGTWSSHVNDGPLGWGHHDGLHRNANERAINRLRFPFNLLSFVARIASSQAGMATNEIFDDHGVGETMEVICDKLVEGGNTFEGADVKNFTSVKTRLADVNYFGADVDRVLEQLVVALNSEDIDANTWTHAFESLEAADDFAFDLESIGGRLPVDGATIDAFRKAGFDVSLGSCYWELAVSLRSTIDRAEVISYEDADRIALSADSFERMSTLIGLQRKMLRSDWFRLLGQYWSMCDRIGFSRHVLCRLLGTTGPLVEMMDDAECKAYDALPDMVTCYRGCGPRNMLGASWSLSRSVAEGFPKYLRYYTDDPRLVTARVRKSRIIALKLDREEQEIITFSARRVMIEPFPQLTVSESLPLQSKA
jgi:hypothetical protein